MKRLGTALALALAAVSAGASAAPARRTLPFIEDDYPKAAAEARSKNIPLFIEAWAPW